MKLNTKLECTHQTVNHKMRLQYSSQSTAKLQSIFQAPSRATWLLYVFNKECLSRLHSDTPDPSLMQLLDPA